MANFTVREMARYEAGKRKYVILFNRKNEKPTKRRKIKETNYRSNSQ